MNSNIHKIRHNVYHIYDSAEAFYSLIIGSERALRSYLGKPVL